MPDQEIVIPFREQRKSKLHLFYSMSPLYHRPLVEHFHPELEIHIIENGRGTYVFNNEKHDIAPHDIYFFRSNERHYVTYRTPDDNGNPSSSYGIYYLPELIQYLDMDMFDTNYMKIFATQNRHFINQVPRDSLIARQIYDLSRQIIDEFETQKPGYEMMITLQMISIIANYARLYSPEDVNRLAEHPYLSLANQSSIHKVMTYIDDHLCEKLTLDDLAGMANMSSSYFSKMFKNLNGFSPWDYIIQGRISLAKQLLQSTDLTVLDIAVKCGFNNCANFNRQFRKITATSPSEFRRTG